MCSMSFIRFAHCLIVFTITLITRGLSRVCGNIHNVGSLLLSFYFDQIVGVPVVASVCVATVYSNLHLSVTFFFLNLICISVNRMSSTTMIFWVLHESGYPTRLTLHLWKRKSGFFFKIVTK